MRIPAACLALVALACAPAVASTAKARAAEGPLGPVTKIVVEAVGEDPQHLGCDDFKPTSAQVLDFLRHAVVVTPAQTHHAFDDGPCSARGTLVTRYGSWHWQLYNMGTAWLTPVDDESRAVMLADPRQELPAEH